VEITKEQVAAVTKIVVAVGAAIREVKQIPSGHLYSTVCDILTLDQYNSVLDKLKQAKVIKVENHLITWIGD
jgi:hypothetical protein